MVLVGATVFVGAAVVGDEPAVAEAALNVAVTLGAVVAGVVAAASGVGVLPVGALVVVDALVAVDALVVGFVAAVAGAVVAGVAIPDGVTLLLLEPSEQAVRTTAMSAKQMSGRIRNRRTIGTCTSRGKPHRPSLSLHNTCRRGAGGKVLLRSRADRRDIERTDELAELGDVRLDDRRQRDQLLANLR
jgi:hypothetical protein